MFTVRAADIRYGNKNARKSAVYLYYLSRKIQGLHRIEKMKKLLILGTALLSLNAFGYCDKGGLFDVISGSCE